mgnify:CR=1 FL=1
MSSETGTSNTAGNNNDAGQHKERQEKLQKNINKLKNKGATKEAIAALEAKKAKEAKEFKQNTEGLQAGKEWVKNELGLVEKKLGPFDYLQQGKTTGLYATKYAGTKDADFYGAEASKATNEYLVSIGEAKKNPSGSYTLTAQGWKMKYGSYTPGQAQTGAAMGSGNPAGIMTSTPISQPMWKQQQKTKAILLGGLSFMTGGGLSSMALRAGAFDAINQSGQTGYANYLSKFYTSQGKDVSSSGIKSGNVDTSGSEVSSAGIINTSVTDNQSIDVAGTFKKKKAGQGADTIAGDRSLFATTDKTITGSMTT